MSQKNHQLVRDFFRALASGSLSEDLLTGDMTAWTLTGGESDKAKVQGGVNLLATIFGGTLSYHIDAITAEQDRAVAEARSTGTLVNGEAFTNSHVFCFRIRDGRIAHVAEYMDPRVVNAQLLPLMKTVMSSA